MDIINLLSNDILTDMTGNRFWLDGIKKEPGILAEKNSYITYDNVSTNLWFKVVLSKNEEKLVPERVGYTWTPAGIFARYKWGGFEVSEKKFITRDDVFGSVFVFENTSGKEISVDVEISTYLTEVKDHFRSLYNPGFIEYENVNAHGVGLQTRLDVKARNVLRETSDANIVFFCKFFSVTDTNDTFGGRLILKPGEKAEISVLGSISHKKSVRELYDLLEAFSEKNVCSVSDKEITNWFSENVPEFSCSDLALTKLYYYRWYIVYKNLINPEIGCFNNLCMYEGKDQFSLLCSASAAMHIRELRWLKDTSYVVSELWAIEESRIKEGVTKGRLRDLYVADIPTAIWETACLMPEKEKKKILDMRTFVKEYVDYHSSKAYIPEGAPLPVVIGSWRTAAEYQPSFFEFTEPTWDHTQSNPFGNEHKTKLHRVDDSVYLCTNLDAVSRLYYDCGEESVAEKYRREAEKTAENIRKYMWDDKTSFYYDLNPENLSRALQSKCYDGFLGAKLEMPQKKREALMGHLENEFSAPYPIPTVARDCPAFSPDNTWKIGLLASGENPYYYNCCWNGPSWNFANSLVIDALGKTVQMSEDRTHGKLFADLFMKWCREQCPDADAVPNACEHYNPFTGEELRAVRDYSHSTFIDIVMRRVVGIMEVSEETIFLNPIDIGLSKLSVMKIPVKGHLLDFVWDEKEENKLQVFCDGSLVYKGRNLDGFKIDLRKDR